MADETKTAKADAAAAADAAPVIGAAPLTAEDPTRSPAPAKASKAAPGFPGFPKTKYHPVYGAQEVKDPNEEATLQPAHNWFDTAAEADAHRTDREAQMVLHQNISAKVGAATTDGETDKSVVAGDTGVVRNSVSATESLKAGYPEPL